MFSSVLPVSTFAAVMLTSASLFATQLIPIADREPSLIGPVNDSTEANKVTLNPTEANKAIVNPTEANKAIVNPTEPNKVIANSIGADTTIINAPRPVPEPTTWGMLILGGGLLTAVRRFRRKQI